MILSAEAINFSYSNMEVLKNVSFNLSKGDCLAILGTNGAGKSTLLKCLNKILTPSRGNVYIDGINIRALKNRELAQTMGYIGQNHKNIRTTVFDFILLGRKPYIKWDVTKEDIGLVEKIIDKFNLAAYAMRYTDELSGGEFQKIVLARAMVQEPNVLLMDEPTSSLDLKNQLDLIKIIKDIMGEEEISVVVTMHDLNLALRFANKFLLLKDGEILFYGGNEIITPESINKVYDIDVNLIEYKGLPIVVPMHKE